MGLSRVLIVFIGLILFNSANAQTWSLSPQTKVGFDIRSMGMSILSGQFTRFKSNMEFDSKIPYQMVSSFEIDVNSLSVSKSYLKDMMMAEDLFHAEKYKSVTFKSTEFKSLGNHKYEVKGLLTMKGITKPTTFTAVFKPRNSNNKVIDIEASTIINRSDFGMKKAFAGVGEKVDIQLIGQWHAQN
jgi:polyisoprenoid-binding protein YceI